jgi:hypothetical protein
MALNKVGARVQGDVYQGLFFWKQAVDLLNPKSMVERVELEHDQADGVDDIAVFYRSPGVNAGGYDVTADYYQVKYHVDNQDCYSSEAIIDPSFIGAKSSLLSRFYKAYEKIGTKHTFRLHLASNWRWRPDDKLACCLREDEGALPRKFFEARPQTEFGKIRETWQKHLDVKPETFTKFAKTLRFQLDHFGRRGFKDLVYTKLQNAGLETPAADQAASPYDSLFQQFLMNGQNSFDAEKFRELCIRERLLMVSESTTASSIHIGVRSFIRFAERLESEVDDMVCVSDQFQGRHPLSETSWKTSARRIITFFGDESRRAKLRDAVSTILLECHGSLALLAGWELSRNSGVCIAPFQKGERREVWRATQNSRTRRDAWESETRLTGDSVDDVAVCLSVTHDIGDDVEGYLSLTDSPQVGRVVLLSPEGGASPQSIDGADHAYRLAAQIPQALKRSRVNRSARTHVFFACPNALMFFIGQHREALGPLILYEFDFSSERDCSYQRSFSLPDVIEEVHHDS